MDENKIELTVELDTAKAEKQADDLNDTLVDGAKDANKEFKKYSNEVNKSLNKIKQQVDKTFNFSKVGNELTSKLGSALGKIKNQISNVLGNIKANFNLNVKSSSSQQGSTGSSGSDSMGASLVTGGAIGAMLSKSLSVTDKMTKGLKNVVTWIGEVAKGFSKVQFGGHDFDTSLFSKGLKDLSELTGESVKKILDDFNYMFKHTNNILNKTEIEVEDFVEAVSRVASTFDSMIGKSIDNIEGVTDGVLLAYTEIMDILRAISKLSQLGNFVPKSSLQKTRAFINDLISMTSGVNKFKLIMATMGDSFNPMATMIDKISTSFPKLGKALTPVANKVKECANSFKQGFAEPQPYIDKMKAKITEWANKHKQATDKVKSANKSVGSSFKSLLQQMLPFASIYGIFNGLKTSITSYANSLQNSARFATVFGNETREMSEWINELNSEITMSKSDLMDFSSNLYRMGKNMGVASDDAKSMAQSMTELGADLYAFTGEMASVEALSAALRGEYDSIQNYGYALDAASVKAQALAMGLDGASESSLLLARQTLLLQQSGDILGYASGQAQTLSGQIAMLKKNFIGLGTSIGACFAGLLQVVLPVLNAIVSAVASAFNKLASIINSIFGLFGIKVGGGASAGGGVVGSAIGGIADSLGDAMGGAGGGASDVADSLADGADSAKKISKELMGIDELHTIALPETSGGGSPSSGSGGSGGSGGGGGGLGDLGGGGLDFTQQESILDSMMGELTDFQKAFLEVWEHLKQGFMVFKDEIIKQWSMLKQNIDKLGQAMADFFVSCWENGLSNSAILIGGIVGSIAVTALKMANSVTQVVTGIFEHINPDNNEHTQKFIDALNNLLLAVQGFIIDIGNWFSQFNEQAQPFYNNLADIGLIIGTIAMQLGADVIQLVRDFMNSWLGQELIEGVCDALERFSGLIEGALAFVRDNLAFFEALGVGITVAYGAFNLINGAIAIWNGLASAFASIGAICSGVASALGSVIAWLASPVGIAVAVIGGLVAVGVLLYKNWDTIKEKCKEVWEAVVQWFNEAGVDIEAILQFIWEKVSEAFQRVWNVVSSIMQNVWDVLVTVWNAIFNTVKDVVTNIWETIKSIFNAISAFIQLVLSIIVGIFTGEWDACYQMTSKFILAILEVIENIFTTIWDFIVDVFDGIKETFVSAWNGMLEILTTTLDNMYQGVKDKFDTVVEFLVGIVERIKGIFDFEWSLPKPKMPKIEWSMADTGFMGLKVPTFKINWMSSGGLVPTKTLFGIGDANNGKGSNMEAVIPLDMMWNKLNEQFDKQNKALANNNSSQPMNITLQLDGQILGKATFSSLEELSRRGIIDLSDLV